MDISTIVFLGDNVVGPFNGGQKSYGLVPDHESSENTSIEQSGNFNEASMIADIGDDGKQKVQYIHWVGGTSTIQLSEIMCYE